MFNPKPAKSVGNISVIARLALVLALCFMPWHVIAANNKQESSQAVLSACSETAARYAYVRDRLMYQAYGELFTEDAVFAIGPNEVVGRTAIVEALKARGPEQLTRHVITPVQLEFAGEGKARGVSYLTLYAAPRPATGDAPQPISGPTLIGEYHDEFRMTEGGCKFAARRVKLVFTAESP